MDEHSGRYKSSMDTGHMQDDAYQTRIARMIQQAQDGNTDARIAEAANGRLTNMPKASSEPWERDRNTCPPKLPRDGEPPYKQHPRRERHRHGHSGWLARKLTGIVALLVLLAVAYLFLWPRLQAALTPSFSVQLPESAEGFLPDEKMGYSAIDFSNAILGESREKKELVVMEQDVEVTSQISQDLLNISLFSKEKIIHSFGTGIYTVKLESLGEQDIVFNESTGVITVTIPHAELSYVNVDVDKTKFENTQKAPLAVGDIKLTAEQKHVLDQSVDTALHERLTDPALFTKADEIALIKVRELLQSPVTALSDAVVVKVVMA